MADRPAPARNPHSLYRGQSIDNNLFFEVGNRAVLAAVHPRGRLSAVRIFTGNSAAEVPLPGVWFSFQRLQWDFGPRDPFRFGLESGGRTMWLDAPQQGQEMSLAGGAWPTVAVTLGPCRATQTFICPIDGQGRPLRVVLMVLRLEPVGSEPVVGRLLLPTLPPATAKSGSSGAAELVLLDEPQPTTGQPPAIDIRPGASRKFVAALVLAENAPELSATRRRLASRSGRQWVESTVDFHARRLVRLRVEGRDHPVGSLLRRAQFVASITPLATAGGEPVGTSWGTLAYEKDWIWMTDAFYNYLGAGLADPAQWLDGARFFAFRSVPDARALEFWRREKRYQKYRAVELASRVDSREALHSLTNLLAPVVLAATYHHRTGDVDALRRITVTDPVTGRQFPLLERLDALLTLVLDSRRPDEPWLFRSVWISDGPARGRYHTGSNILAWYALSQLARLKQAIDPEDPRAVRYADAAVRVRQAIRQHCRIELAGQAAWNEGSGLRGFIHDGEQSSTTLAPWLGFCPADEPELLRFKQWGASARNPVWSSSLSAFTWPLDRQRFATFPGYLSELAAAGDDRQVAQQLDKLVALADADGQWWWWPKEEHKPDRMLRGPAGKCGWATSVFVARFVHGNLGVDWDAPTRSLAVRPFVPWSDYGYEGLVIGSLKLDFETVVTPRGARLRLKHNQQRLDRLTLVVRAPRGTRDAKLVHGPVGAVLRGADDYFAAPTWEVTVPRPVDREVSVELAWDAE